jgi:two-component system, NarL family, sensor kinase
MSQNKDILITFFVITGVLLLLVVFIFIYASLFQKRKIQFIQEKVALKSQYDQEILTSQIEVQNTTLQYIGQELHDNIGQLLSVAKINLNVLEETMQDAAGGEPHNEEFIKQTNELIEQAIHDLRSLSKSLDGNFVHDFGLQQSIAHELQRIRKTKKFETELTLHGEKYTLGYEREIVLFRIVQEILNNALKHSKAKNIEVNIKYLPDNFTLSVTDNGKGFDFEAIMKNELSQSGAGLRNIRRRATLINFDCEIDSQINQGTKYILSKKTTPLQGLGVYDTSSHCRRP